MEDNEYKDNSYGADSANNDPPSSLYSYSYIKHDHKETQTAPPQRHKKSGFGWILLKTAGLAVLFGLIAGVVFQGVSYYLGGDLEGSSSKEASLSTSEKNGNDGEDTADASTTTAQEDTKDVSDIVTEAMPSIVAITNVSETTYSPYFNQSGTRESCGSGIIVQETEDVYYIVSNNHVVDGAKTLIVAFADGTEAQGEIKGTDANTDLAVVSVAKADLSQDTLNTIKVANVGDSTELKVGERAIAIGNALGYGQSVTKGIISALDREVTIDRVTNALIQTDAAINPGNSGGALLNGDGQVIGINSVKFSSTEVEGMGYAIPMETAKPMVDKLINRQVVDEANSSYLGVSGVDVTDTAAQIYKMPEGVYIAQVVEGSAAESAGLTKGDIITSFDGEAILTMDGLKELMQYYPAGTKVDIGILRAVDGEYQEQIISVTLGTKTAEE